MARTDHIYNTAQCIRRGGVTFYRSGDIWIARDGSRYVSDAESKELKAIYQSTWRNLQRVWRAFGGGLKGLFTIREGRQLDYHRFLSLNLDPPVVALTPEQAAASATLAGPYWVSQGTLQPTVDVRIEEGMFVSSLQQGDVGPRERLLFVMLQQMPGDWVAGRVIPLKNSQFTLHNGFIAMPYAPGQWGTFVLMRQRRDKTFDVTTQRLVGQTDTAQ